MSHLFRRPDICAEIGRLARNQVATWNFCDKPGGGRGEGGGAYGVTVTAADHALRLPAWSRARTRNLYVLPTSRLNLP